MRKISLCYNGVPKSARKAILEVFDSGQFSPGPKVREFEEKFAQAHKAKHAVFVNSGTDALRLSLLAMKEKYRWLDGSGVLVPALTFVATVNVVIQAGLRPILVDVRPGDYLMDPDEMTKAIDFKTAAVMPVHLFGQSCDSRVFEVAKAHGLKVLEDSCETILNPIQGDVSCHSTYMAHHMTTGVGGLALTNDEELNWLIRSYANHGRDVAYIPGFRTNELSTDLLKKRFRFPRIGYSSRGTEFEAALGLSQLPHLEKQIDDRQRVFRDLFYELCGFGDLRIVSPENNSCMMFPLVLYRDSKVDKYDLCLFLEKNGIETRDMMPITTQPCYPGMSPGWYPVAQWVNKNGFYIPCHPGMTAQDVRHIGKVFGRFFHAKKSERKAPGVSHARRLEVIQRGRVAA